MLTLPTKFATELAKVPNTPAFLVELDTGNNPFNEQTLSADWAANTQNSQVEWTSQTGSVNLTKTIETKQLAGVAWFALYTPGLTPVTATVWQSFRQTM